MNSNNDKIRNSCVQKLNSLIDDESLSRNIEKSKNNLKNEQTYNSWSIFNPKLKLS